MIGMLIFAVIFLGMAISEAVMFFATWAARRDARKWHAKYCEAMKLVETARIQVEQARQLMNARSSPYYRTFVNGGVEWPDILTEND